MSAPSLTIRLFQGCVGQDVSSKRLGNMLKITEGIPITLNGELDPFERLIEQAQKPLSPQEFTLTQTFMDLIEESLTRGWIYSTSLQELVAAMDPRLAGFSIDGLAQVFDFEEVQVWANSTRSMPRDRMVLLPCAMPPFCSFSSKRWASGSTMRRSAPG